MSKVKIWQSIRAHACTVSTRANVVWSWSILEFSRMFSGSWSNRVSGKSAQTQKLIKLLATKCCKKTEVGGCCSEKSGTTKCWAWNTLKLCLMVLQLDVGTLQRVCSEHVGQEDCCHTGRGKMLKLSGGNFIRDQSSLFHCSVLLVLTILSLWKGDGQLAEQSGLEAEQFLCLRLWLLKVEHPSPSL